MKRFLSCVLALLLALGCFSAGAETVTLSDIDLSQMMALASMDDPSLQDEQTQQILSALLDILKKMNLSCAMEGENGQFDLSANGVTIGSVGLQVGEEQLTIVSDLFPNYAIVCTADELQTLMQGTNVMASSTLGMVDVSPTSGIDENVAQVEALLQTTADLLASKKGQPVPGEYTFGGETYTHMIPFDLTLADIYEIELQAGFMEEADAATLETLRNIPCQVKEYVLLDAEGNAAAYPVYMEGSAANEGTVLCGSWLLTAEQLHAMFGVGMGDMTSIDEVMAAAQAGASDVVAMDFSMSSNVIEAMSKNETEELSEGFDFTFGMYSEGIYMGFTMNGTVQENPVMKLSLDMLVPGNPVISCTLTGTEGANITLPVTTEGKTVLTLTALTSDSTAEDALVADITNIGLNTWMVNLANAMPDELNALLTVIGSMATTEDGTAVIQ